jgi:hypothetical protein
MTSPEAHSARVTYSFPLILRAARRTLMRRSGLPGGIAAGLLLVSAGCSWIGGHGAIISSSLIVMLIVVIFFPLFYYLMVRRHWNERLARMGSPEAEIILSDDHFLLASGMGESKVNWNQFSEVRKYPEMWLLYLGPNQPVTLPLAGVSPEFLAFLEARIAGASQKKRPPQ